jgi:hypothetical protein
MSFWLCPSLSPSGNHCGQWSLLPDLSIQILAIQAPRTHTVLWDHMIGTLSSLLFPCGNKYQWCFCLSTTASLVNWSPVDSLGGFQLREWPGVYRSVHPCWHFCRTDAVHRFLFMLVQHIATPALCIQVPVCWWPFCSMALLEYLNLLSEATCMGDNLSPDKAGSG